MQAFAQKHYYLLLILALILIITCAFYAGYGEGKKAAAISPVTLSCAPDVLSELTIPVSTFASGKVSASNLSASATTQSVATGKYVGSKNGTKYYSPGCAAANRIKTENKVWFESAEDATLQGYTRGSC